MYDKKIFFFVKMQWGINIYADFKPIARVAVNQSFPQTFILTLICFAVFQLAATMMHLLSLNISPTIIFNHSAFVCSVFS
jgi:hypothetical protein